MWALLLVLCTSGCTYFTEDEIFELQDRDGDGFLPAEIGGPDCDNDDPDVHPDAEERCGDGIDNDCNGAVDDVGIGSQVFFFDGDGDGFGDDKTQVFRCLAGEAEVDGSGDCDDGNANAYPGGDEVCDGIDNDCDGDTDEDDVHVDWYRDRDGDGFGDPNDMLRDCRKPDGYIPDGGDCDDRAANVHPGGTEVWYDGEDGDCDGWSDYDMDHDGEDAQPHGWDCDDDNDAINSSASEIWYDGVDQNCDGFSDFDMDFDNFDSASELSGGTDCDDDNPNVNPGTAEVCGDQLDNDCDGTHNACDYRGQQGLPPDVTDIYTNGAEQPQDLCIGDINGDGTNDLIIAAQGTGKSWVFQGLSRGASVPLSSADWIIDVGTGDSADRTRCATGGDIHGNGITELLISNPRATVQGDQWAGQVHIFPDTAFVPGVQAVTAAAANSLRGQGPDSRLGLSIAWAGDLDDDSYDDFVIGSTLLAAGNYMVKSPPYTVSARNVTSNATISASSTFADVIVDDASVTGWGLHMSPLGSSAGFLISSSAGTGDVRRLPSISPPYAGSGTSLTVAGVSSAEVVSRAIGLGDITGDRVDDVGITLSNSVGPYGIAIVDGTQVGSVGPQEVAINVAVAWLPPNPDQAAGDLNGDGFRDLVIGASASNGGQLWVFYGPVAPDTYTAADGTLLGGFGEGIGVRLAVGDLDGDGYDDIAASRTAGDGVYIVYGTGR